MAPPRCTARAGAALACSTLVLAIAAALMPVAAAADEPAVVAARAADSAREVASAVPPPTAEAPAAEIPAAEGPLQAVVDAPPARAAVPVPLPNRPPVVGDDRVVVAQGGTATIDLFANDTDPDGDAISLVGGTSAGHGTVSFADGLATYAADTDFAGEDAFVYVVGDSRGATASGTVRVTVTPAQEPVAPPVSEPMKPAPAVVAPAPVQPVRATAPVAARPVAAQGAPTRPQPVAAVRSAAPRAEATTAAAMGPSTTPYVAPAAPPATLPFTGGAIDVLLPLGLGLLLAGGLLTAGASPRRHANAVPEQPRSA